jgi:hypothetical protein
MADPMWTLRSELLNDPLGWGYAAMSNAQAADKLTATNTGRTVPRTEVPVREVFNAIVNADWPAQSANQDKLAACLNMQSLDMSNANTRGILASIFPAGSQTRTNLQALASRPVSRAEELGIGIVTEGMVSQARSGVW